ncbi:MAG TPA: hypothetical protein VHK67_04790 [Rhabdochlamydiaceae bacterium]|jgi:hypothetical protein|nr:hypothetical protein [Rhabdochlamydiaceae bacterium]
MRMLWMGKFMPAPIRMKKAGLELQLSRRPILKPGTSYDLFPRFLKLFCNVFD